MNERNRIDLSIDGVNVTLNFAVDEDPVISDSVIQILFNSFLDKC